MAKNPLSPSWSPILKKEFDKEYMQSLLSFLEKEVKNKQKIAPPGNFFKALTLTPFNEVKVVILGQDPYPTLGHANGLAFAVNEGIKTPKSLHNIFLELSKDLKVEYPQNNTLLGWANQGVLLLNTVLTTRIGEPFSHRNHGWEYFTDKIILELNKRPEPIIFLLWGKPAQDKRRLISNNHHKVLMASHPSPLSAHRGFFGCKHFSKVNDILKQLGTKPIDWEKTGL